MRSRTIIRKEIVTQLVNIKISIMEDVWFYKIVYFINIIYIIVLSIILPSRLSHISRKYAKKNILCKNHT